MRQMIRQMLCCTVLLAGCAAGSNYVGNAPRELELTLDDGHPAQRPVLPVSSYELLIKAEPNLPKFKPVRVRFLVAQPGRLVFNLYDTEGTGKPGKLLASIDRNYGPELTSNGNDGKWVVERLPELPAQKGTLWLGVGVSDVASEGRVWAAANDSGGVYQRDQQPGTALISAAVHYTPMVRLAVQPE